MKLSGVLLVHNEQKLLPYALYSLFHSNLDELIIVMDRCVDRSADIVKRFLWNSLFQSRSHYTVEVAEKKWNKWKNPIAESAEYGFSLATGDIIFSLGSDVYVDNKMFNAEWFNGYDMVGFQCLSWDMHFSRFRTSYEACLKRLYRRFNVGGWYGGVFGVKREVWRKHHFQDCSYGKGKTHPQFIIFKQRIMQDGYKYRYVSSTQNLALRSIGLYRENQWLQGKTRRALGFPLWKVVLHSAVHLKPDVLMGFLNNEKQE
jgi:glycosyltransferase involved in cell wall biosynthesis